MRRPRAGCPHAARWCASTRCRAILPTTGSSRARRSPGPRSISCVPTATWGSQGHVGMAPRRRGTSPSVCTSEARPTLRLKEALVDRYTLERQLGAGGMATVYLAHDVRHNRKVAIKVMHAELAALIGPERFLKEIETTANLQHPHILPLFDSGQVRRARLRSPPGRDSPRHQAGKRAVPRRPG